jgi:hypothetical protein
MAEMVRTCSAHGTDEKFCTILLGRYEGKDISSGIKSSSEENIKMSGS